MLDLYFMQESPPCRAVLMTAKLLGIDLNLISLNLALKEHFNENFSKINPRRCVPTLVDNGFVLWESRAIMTYLVNKYSPNSSLYPSALDLRAQIDQYLYFDIEKISLVLQLYLKPIIESKLLDKNKLEDVTNNLKLLNTLLSGKNFLVNEKLTLADISLISTMSTLEAIEYDLSQFESIIKWKENVKAIFCYNEVNTEAVKNMHHFVQQKIKELKKKSST